MLLKMDKLILYFVSLHKALLETQYTNEQIKQRLNDINKAIDEHKPNKEFDSYLFKKLVDEITINDRNKLTFKFKIGLVRTIIVPIK